MNQLRLETIKSQLQSARKNILFMETEHAKTLHGLHNEIKSLQSKCNGKFFGVLFILPTKVNLVKSIDECLLIRKH